MTTPVTNIDANRPGLAIIAPTQEPYRHALHRRIVTEIPEFKLHSVYTHAAGSANRARRDEADINAVFFDTGETALERNKPAHQFRNYRRGKRIFRYLKDNNVKAAIILGYNDLGLLGLYKACHNAGITTYLWTDSNIHTDRAEGVRRRIKKQIIQHVTSYTDVVFCCGSLGSAFFQSYGVPESMIRYSPYEPDYDLIKNLDESTIKLTRERFKLNPERKRFIFCGRLVPNKRPDLAISSFIQVADDRPNWDLVVVGSGDTQHELEQSVPDRLKHRVLFTGFIDDQETVSSLYRLSDILVHPCVIEPWGLIINEAAAAGLAIITTSACGAGPELVDPGKNGFLIEPAASLPLTKAMLHISKPGTTETFKAESQRVLKRWRGLADPVDTIRAALIQSGLIGDNTIGAP
ncbi:MAG: hypothetical protein COB69_02660 [Phycisphaera sp.]|nr:MAG: hypothetical protein COB69_02660 [Phycisphaera sp.]